MPDLARAPGCGKGLPLVEEIGVDALALIEILGGAARLIVRPQRNLWRLVVDGVERLQLPPRVARGHLSVILPGLVGEAVEALSA